MRFVTKGELPRGLVEGSLWQPGGTNMNASRAVELLGPHIQPGPSLSSVIETLGTLSKLGTPTDAERLDAAVWVQKNHKDYEAEAHRRLAAR